MELDAPRKTAENAVGDSVFPFWRTDNISNASRQLVLQKADGEPKLIELFGSDAEGLGDVPLDECVAEFFEEGGDLIGMQRRHDFVVPIRIGQMNAESSFVRRIASQLEWHREVICAHSAVQNGQLIWRPLSSRRRENYLVGVSSDGDGRSVDPFDSSVTHYASTEESESFS